MKDNMAFGGVPANMGFGSNPAVSLLRFQNTDKQRHLVVLNVEPGTTFTASLVTADGDTPLDAPLPKVPADIKPPLPPLFAPEKCRVISFAGIPIGSYTYTLMTTKPDGMLRVDEISIDVLSDAEAASIRAGRERYVPVKEPVQFEG